MKKTNKIILAIGAIILILIGALFIFNVVEIKFKKQMDVANPAAVFCVEQGGESKIVTNEDGSQSGVCIIGGQEYDDWEYFRSNNIEENN